jgi:hypothetical protein
MARETYLLALAMITAIIVLVGLRDLCFWAMGKETISAWLRLHSDWYVWPAFAMLLFLAGLTWHLFAED